MLEITKINLSVIIPIYNTKKEYLEKALNSVSNQKLDNIEIILILDGCNKETEKICIQFQEKDSRIKIYKQQNKGEGASRNKAIELAKRKLDNIYRFRRLDR